MVAKKITSWKEILNSSALDNYRTTEAGVIWTAAKYHKWDPLVEMSKVMFLEQLLKVSCYLELVAGLLMKWNVNFKQQEKEGGWLASLCYNPTPKGRNTPSNTLPSMGTYRLGRGWKERKEPQGGCSVRVSLHGSPGIANGIEQHNVWMWMQDGMQDWQSNTTSSARPLWLEHLPQLPYPIYQLKSVISIDRGCYRHKRSATTVEKQT